MLFIFNWGTFIKAESFVSKINMNNLNINILILIFKNKKYSKYSWLKAENCCYYHLKYFVSFPSMLLDKLYFILDNENEVA